jgi:hypothetical protein
LFAVSRMQQGRGACSAIRCLDAAPTPICRRLLPPASPNNPTASSGGWLLHNYLIELPKFGAGDGIRTHDPNLGKVVLYP